MMVVRERCHPQGHWSVILHNDRAKHAASPSRATDSDDIVLNRASRYSTAQENANAQSDRGQRLVTFEGWWRLVVRCRNR